MTTSSTHSAGAIEAKASVELYKERSTKTRSHRSGRSLSLLEDGSVYHPDRDDEHHLHRHDRHNRRRHRPLDGTQHGMMIDAGSQGTRIHVYEFEARILSHKREVDDAVAGRKLSIPTTDTRWTNRLKPGLDTFAYIETEDDMMQQVSSYLRPLLEFAKDVLQEKKGHWHTYPIYLKATGGLRTLPRPYRIRLMSVVRRIMHSTKFNPFFFETEHARVISGEEEAIYGWTAVNFVKGALIHNSKGTGAVSRANKTYGILEMGGASAQIGFYEPNGDVMANLFKLQLGAAKHWNVYTHSFLWFGVNEAYARLNAMLVAVATKDKQTTIYNPCLPGGSEYLFTSRVQLTQDGALLPLSSPEDAMILEADLYSAVLSNPNPRGDFDVCYAYTQQLLRKEANAWCDFAHDRDCSFAGIYQPPLPIHGADFGEFIATSNFYDVWEFLQLRPRSSMLQLKDAARRKCSWSLEELQLHNRHLANPVTEPNELTAMCFRAAFVATFLIDGVGFPLEYSVTALDIVNGQKVGWALGSMLYEINTLPWEFKKRYLTKLLSMDLTGVGTHDSSTRILMTGILLGVVVFTGIMVMLVHRRTWHDKRQAGISTEASRLLPGR